MTGLVNIRRKAQSNDYHTASRERYMQESIIVSIHYVKPELQSSHDYVVAGQPGKNDFCKKYQLMRRIVYAPLLFLVISIISCHKETTIPGDQKPPVDPNPEMTYVELNDRVIEYGAPSEVLDINSDGAYDLIFGVLLVGDPIYKVDKYQFMVLASFYTNLPVNDYEQVPVLNKAQSIPVGDFNGFTWYNAPGVTLLEKNIFNNGNITWRGPFIGAVKSFLPFQIEKISGLYNGWVEITDDRMHERIILHRAALSKEAGKMIKAGL